MRPLQGACLVGLSLLALRSLLFASTGSSGAAFLNIPVGAGPAAMGSAYTALATDAYAPTWNPAGLGRVDSLQFAAQHLSYLQETHFEFASAVVPLPRARACANPFWCGASAVGGSIQYFGSGDITGRDASGNPNGDYSSYYAAYNLSYGKEFGERLSLGMTGKLINAKLADVSANAYALDVGGFYKLRQHVQLATTLMNAGSQLTFLNEGDALPLALHVAGAWQPRPVWNLSTELVFPRGSPTSFHLGAEWAPVSIVALRAGFRTDRFSGLSPLAAFSMGVWIRGWGQEFSYAWVPYGNLGDAHYFSFLMRFGDAAEQKRNLIQYGPRKQKTAQRPAARDVQVPESESLMELLSDYEPPVPARKGRAQPR